VRRRPVNSAELLAISVTLLTLLFGSLSAYTIARLRYRWTLFLLQTNIISRFVPAIVLMIPLYIVIRSLGQLNSLQGVIIAETGFLLPYAILILAPYFDAIPSELEEAARIDGCTRLRAFVHNLRLAGDCTTDYGYVTHVRNRQARQVARSWSVLPMFALLLGAALIYLALGDLLGGLVCPRAVARVVH
jgi:hypothetical protein